MKDNQGIIEMSSRGVVGQTVPQGFQLGENRSDAGRKRLRGSDRAAEVVRLKMAQREREEAERQARRDEALAVARGVEETLALAKVRGEEVETRPSGAVEVARDGLRWLERKGKLSAAHVSAGLRFRADYETAMGGGLGSCLRERFGASGGVASVTDAMVVAKGAVDAALAAMGTPYLTAYVKLVAGEGTMLNAEPFCKDPKRAGEHELPCVIAFDVLARHYGLIR